MSMYEKELIGKRIRINQMEDLDPISSGTEGTIVDVDGIGQYVVKWDNGRTLSVIPEEDDFDIIDNWKLYREKLYSVRKEILGKLFGGQVDHLI